MINLVCELITSLTNMIANMIITANLEKASTSTLVDVALSIDSSTDLLGVSTALSKDNE